MYLCVSVVLVWVWVWVWTRMCWIAQLLVCAVDVGGSGSWGVASTPRINTSLGFVNSQISAWCGRWHRLLIFSVTWQPILPSFPLSHSLSLSLSRSTVSGSCCMCAQIHDICTHTHDMHIPISYVTLSMELCTVFKALISAGHELKSRFVSHNLLYYFDFVVHCARSVISGWKEGGPGGETWVRRKPWGQCSWFFNNYVGHRQQSSAKQAKLK